MVNELPVVRHVPPKAEPGRGCSIPRPGERPKRKLIPLKVRLEACLLLLGLDPKEVEWDHFPALQLRPVNAEGIDYEPPQHHPRYIQPLSKAAHALKTNGPKHDRSNADKSRIAKVKRLVAKTSTSCVEARRAGVQAALTFGSASDNPYPAGSLERTQWSAGWHGEMRPKLLTGWRKRGGTKRKIPSRPFPERWKPTGETK